MYRLYVDGGGTATCPTYFSYFCPDYSETFWTGNHNETWFPVQMVRFPLSKLTPDVLPYGCSVYSIDGKSSNNEAEFCSLYYGLERFISVVGNKPVEIFQDSELIVSQVNTRCDLFNAKKYYECKAVHLIPWLDAIERIWYSGINLKWIPREEIVKILHH